MAVKYISGRKYTSKKCFNDMNLNHANQAFVQQYLASPYIASLWVRRQVKHVLIRGYIFKGPGTHSIADTACLYHFQINILIFESSCMKIANSDWTIKLLDKFIQDFNCLKSVFF